VELVVCIKPVPEAESRLRPTADGRGLDPEAIKFVLAGYDESAVEQALLLKEAIAGSRVRAVSYGVGPRTEEVLRAALALGCDAATWVEAPIGSAPDALDASRALAFAVRRYSPDLILLGKQSGDEEASLVPSSLASRLALPGFGSVLDLRWEASRSRFRFQRLLEGGAEAWEVPPPLVIALQQAWNDPRTAKLQNILKSRKMPIERIAPTEIPDDEGDRPRATPRRFLLPPPRTGAKMITFQSPEEAAQKLVRALREEAKVLP
jgi:electron transfer flavoprotein beta subunit